MPCRRPHLGSFIANGATGSAYSLPNLFGIQLHAERVVITQDPKADKGARTRRYLDVPIASVLPGAC